ncbi:MAG TPA: tetratricopeptide repeat protein, partial [Burkholderiaceae bacterium]|nr:tetratricopeptide repeat protein [Burkholderiaceae bacterium]
SDYLRGLQLAKRECWAQAAEAFHQATRRNPDDAVFWLNLAHARVKLGELEQGVIAARRAAALDPHSELAISIATQCLAAANRHEEMIELLQQMDLATVEDPGPHFSLGDAYCAMYRYTDAVSAYLSALQRKPNFIPAHVHLGNVFERMKMHEEARECFKTALALGANRAEMLSAMAYESHHACRFDLAVEDCAQLQHAFDEGLTQAVPFQLLTVASTRAQQLAAAKAHWKDRCGAIEPLPRPRPRNPKGRVRVGYATGDLFRHATAYLIADVLERHDRERFEIFLYSFGPDDGSEIRKRIIAAAEHFVDARQMSDRALANRIRSDDIDVLLDLKGYTLNARFGVFALHAARIQVNFLGYPGTMGASCYEYIIGDRIVTPLEHAASYSEKIAQMPHCYQPNDRQRQIGPRPTRAECGLPQEGFVFCSFNNSYKITASVFDLWCRLLRQIDGSVLWLYEANPQARRNLLLEAQRRGISPERLVWAPHVSLELHLARLQLADLALDTSPVNAHTTASDALWAGVPMITTAGDSFVSRVASSVLHAADLPELVAAHSQAYEQLALELAQDPERLRSVRQRLASNRTRCALFDSEQYTRDLEALFARMLAVWERGAPAEHLPTQS